MRRGTKCVAQTINLSNPETCIRPKRIQKLVQAEVMHPCPSIGVGGTAYWTPKPVTIKICTRKDMQRTCPPKICDCPQKTQRRTIRQKLCSALFFLLKSGIAAGLVYWTHSEGLWGSSADVEDLYRRIMATIMPALADEYGKEVIELPRISEFKYSLVQKYNHAVFTVMECIMSASAMLRKQLQNIMLAIEPPKDKPAESQSSQVEVTEAETEDGSLDDTEEKT
ncbi:PREDICTED: uncharacterized protein LOC108551627 [Eufriesea mexicana]|uniref:uncharacterized protein LOC108551627 n=1 Tax=Eufriesea mexicana TaxID=516756 RepID=UPI00083C68F7|nr:PREDICTED: uncharacterized protein LOC108551627 [Eufriesea mexicana]